MSFLKNVKSVLRIFSNKKIETAENQYKIKTEREFNSETNKHYGVHITHEGDYSNQFRSRLNNVFYNHYFVVFYKKDNKKIELCVTNDEKQIDEIMNKYELILDKLLVGSLFYRSFYFEDINVASQFESLIQTKVQQAVDKQYQEYFRIKTEERRKYNNKNS